MAIEMKTGVNIAPYTETMKMAKAPKMPTPVPTTDLKVAESVQDKDTAQFTQSGNTGEQQEGTGKEQNDSRRIKSAIDHANTTMKQAKTKCEFSYHEETKRVSIKVIDQDTEEVIKEIPPEETLEMIAKMWELAGILVDEKR